MHYLESYARLIDQFLRNRLPVAEFERQYLKLFKNDSTQFTEAEFAALDNLFSAVDAYCGDPALRGNLDIDEDELRRSSAVALALLPKFTNQD
jgi:hypothetical protein